MKLNELRQILTYSLIKPNTVYTSNKLINIFSVNKCQLEKMYLQSNISSYIADIFSLNDIYYETEEIVF